MSSFSAAFKQAVGSIDEWRYSEMKMFAEWVLDCAREHDEADWTDAANWVLHAAQNSYDVITSVEAENE